MERSKKMIVVLPTTTGFLVGNLPLATEKKNRLKKLYPKGPKTHRRQLAVHWKGVREWMRQTAARPN